MTLGWSGFFTFIFLVPGSMNFLKYKSSRRRGLVDKNTANALTFIQRFFLQAWAVERHLLTFHNEQRIQTQSILKMSGNPNRREPRRKMGRMCHGRHSSAGSSQKDAGACWVVGESGHQLRGPFPLPPETALMVLTVSRRTSPGAPQHAQWKRDTSKYSGVKFTAESSSSVTQPRK